MSQFSAASPVSPRTNRIVGLAIVLGLVVIVILSSLDNLTDIFGRENYRVKAYFNNIGELRTGAPVSYGGVKIGRVKDISLQQDGRVQLHAELFLKRPVPIDSILAIDSTTVSGDTFVSLIPGDSSQEIHQAQTYDNAPVLRHYDYFGFSDVSKLASTIGAMAQETFGNFEELANKDGKFLRQVKKIQSRVPQIKEEYQQLIDRYKQNEPQYKKQFEQISRMLEKAQKLQSQITACFTPEQLRHNQATLEAISFDKDVLNNMWQQNKGKFTHFQQNYKILAERFSGFCIGKTSVIGLLMTDDCMGIPQTVKDIQSAIAKVSDMSLLKKIGIYFDGKDLFDDFLKNAPPSAKMDAGMLYQRWVRYIHERRMKTLRQTPTSCQIKGARNKK